MYLNVKLFHLQDLMMMFVKQNKQRKQQQILYTMTQVS